MELLSNEYHLVGPVASPTKRNGCSLDCTRMIDDASRRRKRIDDQRNGARFPRTSIIDRLEDLEPIFHSTGISADEKDNAEPMPEPSKRFLRTPSPAPARNAKKARVEDRGVQRADEKDDDETTTEEDMDCTCDAEAVIRDEHSRVRPLDRSRVIRNGRRRDDAEEDKEDEGERMEEEDEEDEGERMEEEDGDAEEDSAYEELARVPRRRTAAREQELKRWIRRCRQECERRGRKGR